MRIGELARKAGVDVQTVRYYEREKLLEAPARTPAGYRVYGEKHLERLNFVRHCRSLDMPLAEVRALLEAASNRNVPCGDVDRIVHAHLARVKAKRAALEVLEAQLEALSRQCGSQPAPEHRVADCAILGELIHAAHGEACACHPDGEIEKSRG
ncbi:MAG TPA: Cd(II)/Pb(II)-responsive transcriptional regulator [Burkholderiales bacterium]|nr:Cd(II)/Pb(II)-responsive transcriptional regulator [Burkholderiales bacterium]